MNSLLFINKYIYIYIYNINDDYFLYAFFNKFANFCIKNIAIPIIVNETRTANTMPTIAPVFILVADLVPKNNNIVKYVIT